VSLSVVTTLYKSEKYIVEFYERIIKQIKELGFTSYEIIFVNDGSPDKSVEVVKKLKASDDSIELRSFSRNFGHHKAIMYGLSLTQGELVFLVDVDLEEKPELLSEFLKEIKSSRCDVIYGVQEKRKGAIFERWSGSFFYKIFNTLSDTQIEPNQTIARLMTREYVLALREIKENSIFFTGISKWVGFEQKSITVKKGHKKETTYSFVRKLSLFINSITSFSSRPLYYMFYVGFIMFVCSILFSIFLTYKKVFLEIEISGWASLMVSLYLLTGTILISVGILGLYIGRMFNEIKQRPYIIEKEINKDG